MVRWDEEEEEEEGWTRRRRKGERKGERRRKERKKGKARREGGRRREKKRRRRGGRTWQTATLYGTAVAGDSSWPRASRCVGQIGQGKEVRGRGCKRGLD